MQYTELHCKTNFSFLEGASHPSELVEQAAALQYAGLAITDRNSLAGVVRAHMAALDVGCPLIIGAEITPYDAPHVVLWTSDRDSYGHLCRLITAGRRTAPKGECQLSLADIAQASPGLLAGVVPGTHLQATSLGLYRDIFGDRCYLLLEFHKGHDDQAQLAALQALSRQTNVPAVAAGNVHYHIPARMVVHDVLTAIRHGTTVSAADGKILFSNAAV